jgi:hypothetical protein
MAAAILAEDGNTREFKKVEAKSFKNITEDVKSIEKQYSLGSTKNPIQREQTKALDEISNMKVLLILYLL